MTADKLDDRFARLREEWPVASMTDDVMARVRTETLWDQQRSTAKLLAIACCKRGPVFGLLSKICAI